MLQEECQRLRETVSRLVDAREHETSISILLVHFSPSPLHLLLFPSSFILIFMFRDTQRTERGTDGSVYQDSSTLPQVQGTTSRAVVERDPTKQCIKVFYPPRFSAFPSPLYLISYVLLFLHSSLSPAGFLPRSTFEEEKGTLNDSR